MSRVIWLCMSSLGLFLCLIFGLFPVLPCQPCLPSPLSPPLPLLCPVSQITVSVAQGRVCSPSSQPRYKSYAYTQAAYVKSPEQKRRRFTDQVRVLLTLPGLAPPCARSVCANVAFVGCCLKLMENMSNIAFVSDNCSVHLHYTACLTRVQNHWQNCIVYLILTVEIDGRYDCLCREKVYFCIMFHHGLNFMKKTETWLKVDKIYPMIVTYYFVG